jgi:hypothetical protein
MSDDRLSHEKFLEELAAFDKMLRAPAEPPRSISRADLGLDETLDLMRPSRDTEALRVQEVPMRSRQSRLSRRWWAGALSVGVLAGGLFGWWLASSPIVHPPPMEPIARERATTTPAVTAPVASSIPSFEPAVKSPPVERPVTTPNTALLPAPPMRDASAIVAAIPSVPAPSIEPPLPAAPVAVRPSMPPAAPPARAAAGALAAAAVAADEVAIETTLRKYEDAYERLDAKAAVAVWPTVDQRALSRAFAGLASQDLVFRGCEVVVRVGATTAQASCRGTAEYVRRIGNPRPYVEPREWFFTLNKTQGEWRIETVDARR